MTIRLATLTDADAEPTARWREAARANLRTPYVLSVDEQCEFIGNLPKHRHEYRYWAVKADDQTVGIAGLNPIEWENGLAEISLVLDPVHIGKGYGAAAFALVLDEAFKQLRLAQVHADVYEHNPALGFWGHMARKYGATQATLPGRKFSGGARHDLVSYSFEKS